MKKVKKVFAVIIISLSMSNAAFAFEPDPISSTIKLLEGYTKNITTEDKDGLLWKSEVISFNDNIQNVSLFIVCSGDLRDEAKVQVVAPDGTIQFERSVNELKDGVWTDPIEWRSMHLEVQGKAANFLITVKTVAETYPPGMADSAWGAQYFESVSRLSVGSQLRRVANTVARLIITPIKLEERNLAEESYSCSGFLVGSSLLMTSRHCVKEVEQCRRFIAVFGYEEDETISSSAYRCKRIAYSNKLLDVVIVELEGTPADVYGRLVLQNIAPQGSLAVVQHPLGMTKRISRDEDCKVVKVRDDGYAINKEDAEHVRGIAFGHKCDTAEGSSGSPVTDLEGALLGIHQRGKSEVDYNKAIRGDFIFSCLEITPSSNLVRPKNGTPLCKNESS